MGAQDDDGVHLGVLQEGPERHWVRRVAARVAQEDPPSEVKPQTSELKPQTSELKPNTSVELKPTASAELKAKTCAELKPKTSAERADVEETLGDGPLLCF